MTDDHPNREDREDMDPEVEAFLAHYGVKGMKWGVIREDVAGARRAASAVSKAVTTARTTDAITEAYKAAIPVAPVLSKAGQAKILAENNKKFLAKAGPPPVDSAVDSGKGWRPTPKQIAWGITGAAFVGLYAYGAYTGRLPAPGRPCSAEQFKAAVTRSKLASWVGSYIQPSSFDRPEFSLPAGHTFHRISMSAEKSFGASTYATHSIEDFNRYVTAFRAEKGSSSVLRHVTFQSKSEIRVPDLRTTLEALRQAMVESGYSDTSPAKVMEHYNTFSGGAWDHGSPTIGGMIKNLASQGYHAFVDEMDAGVIGETPLVLFDKSVLGPKSSTTLTDAAIAKAESSLIEITNRKL